MFTNPTCANLYVTLDNLLDISELQVPFHRVTGKVK